MSFAKKTLMIESCEKKSVLDDFSNTSIVHVRNSKILQERLGYRLITHFEQINSALNETWDNIICHYASPYMKYKMYFELLEKNPDANLFWLVNDHDVEDNILLRNYIKTFPQKKFSVISNNTRHGYRHWILGKNIKGKKLNDFIDRWFCLNLNSLIFAPINRFVPSHEKHGLIYYGTFRKHRAQDMQSFSNLNDYIISTSSKNQIKFKEAGIEPSKFIDKIAWKRGEEDLQKYKYSIYFEDEWTHSNFAFLANRYYECLMCDVLMFFDKKCLNTIKIARLMGYIIPDFVIVENSKELNYRMKLLNNNNSLYEETLNFQRENKVLVLDEQENVLRNIERIMNNEF